MHININTAVTKYVFKRNEIDFHCRCKYDAVINLEASKIEAMTITAVSCDENNLLKPNTL